MLSSLIFRMDQDEVSPVVCDATQEAEETTLDGKQLTNEHILSNLYEQIRPRIEDVMKQVCKEAFPRDETDDEEILKEQSMYFLQMCTKSSDALDELRKVLFDLEMAEAAESLQQLSPVTVEEADTVKGMSPLILEY